MSKRNRDDDEDDFVVAHNHTSDAVMGLLGDMEDDEDLGESLTMRPARLGVGAKFVPHSAAVKFGNDAQALLEKKLNRRKRDKRAEEKEEEERVKKGQQEIEGESEDESRAKSFKTDKPAQEEPDVQALALAITEKKRLKRQKRKERAKKAKAAASGNDPADAADAQSDTKQHQRNATATTSESDLTASKNVKRAKTGDKKPSKVSSKEDSTTAVSEESDGGQDEVDMTDIAKASGEGAANGADGAEELRRHGKRPGERFIKPDEKTTGIGKRTGSWKRPKTRSKQKNRKRDTRPGGPPSLAVPLKPGETMFERPADLDKAVSWFTDRLGDTNNK